MAFGQRRYSQTVSEDNPDYYDNASVASGIGWEVPSYLPAMPGPDASGAVRAGDEGSFGETTIRTSEVGDDTSNLFSILLEAHRREADQPGRVQIDPHLRKMDLEETWDSVREWLTGHPSPEVRMAAMSPQENTTVLHLACKLNNPPVDVIKDLVKYDPSIAKRRDEYDQLPLHCACQNRSSIEVLEIICNAYPEGKIATDRKQRTPLQ